MRARKKQKRDREEKKNERYCNLNTTTKLLLRYSRYIYIIVNTYTRDNRDGIWW